MSLSLSLGKDTILTEARRHPRYDNDPDLYEKLACLKLSSAQDRQRIDAKPVSYTHLTLPTKA